MQKQLRFRNILFSENNDMPDLCLDEGVLFLSEIYTMH